MPGLIVLTQKQVKTMILIQSILSALQTLTAASALGDVIGAKFAALAVVIVAACQQGVNTYLGKTVSDTMIHVEKVVQNATDKVEEAEARSTNLVNSLMSQQTERRNSP